MKLYMLSQTANEGYDTFDSCIVAAENEKEAKKISPWPRVDSETNDNWWEKPSHYCYGWANTLAEVEAIYIGEASPSLSKGLILSSFNAG